MHPYGRRNRRKSSIFRQKEKNTHSIECIPAVVEMQSEENIIRFYIVDFCGGANIKRRVKKSTHTHTQAATPIRSNVALQWKRIATTHKQKTHIAYPHKYPLNRIQKLQERKKLY